MGQQVLKSWFFTLILTIICVSILALNVNERRAFYNSIEQRQQASSQQTQQHKKFHLPRQLSNQSNKHNEFTSTVSIKTASKILIDSPLLIENNATSASVNQGTKKNKVDSSFDNDLLLSSASNGKEKKDLTQPSDITSSDYDNKKTLSQQVKEGKYGLIQNEIYSLKSKRPGIISYLSNSEVPHDTIKNFGGLGEEEIWLAENHVLVLKGGSFSELNSEKSNTEWPPIDNYKAPHRQVKIPVRPKVPPPFPVQLVEGGPIQLISTNGTSLAENETIEFETLSGDFRGFLPGEGPYFSLLHTNNSSNDVTPDLLGLAKIKAKAGRITTPFYPALPLGAVIVPPPSNQSDHDDEDQSIYYPPPYSFVYLQNNSTAIPPGPLVPGIILPPPPDFFSSLDEKKSITKDKHAKRPNTMPISAPRASYLPLRKSGIKFYKTPLSTVSPIGDKTVSYHHKPFVRSKLKNSTSYQYQSEKPTTQDYQTLSLVEMTTPISLKSTTLENSEKYHIQQMLGNQVIESSSRKIPWKTMITSKTVPLITFVATTTAISIEQSIETTPSPIESIWTTRNPIRYPSQASYYFYEESNSEKTQTSTSDPLIFFNTSAKIPSYYKVELSQQYQQQLKKQNKEYYDVEMIPSQQTAKDYNVKLIDSIVKNPQIYRYLDLGATSSQEKFEVPSAKEQSPRVLHSESLYYQPFPNRSVPKLSYFTTQKPKTYYRKPEIIENEYQPSSSKSKPIYQYSFEATNYAKQRGQVLIQKPQIHKQKHRQLIYHQKINESQRQKELPFYSEFQDIQRTKDQYDFESSEVVVDQQVRTQQILYLKGKKNERRPYYHRTTTASPARITTLASHQQYFTKQDEQLLDDVTKEYFTVFGKKLSGSKLPTTTPIYGKSSVTDRPQFKNINDYESRQYNGKKPKAFKATNIKVRYGDQTSDPFALKDDIFVRYKYSLPLSTLDSNSNIISLINVSPRPAVLQSGNQVQEYALSSMPDAHQHFELTQNYGNGKLEQYQQQTQQGVISNSFIRINDSNGMIRETEYFPRSLSLESDISVNYKNLRPPINPDSEFISEENLSPMDSNTDKSNSYFAYRLPGDGGHFYFLTPQAIRREGSNRGYLYS